MKTLLRRLRGKQKSVPPVDINSYQQQLSSLRQQLPDASDQERELIASVQHLTMTSPERILALVKAVEYLSVSQIEGDVVECGVWKGGSMVATANTLIARDDAQRRLWLYDTFEGMSDPTEEDVDFMGQTADRLLGEQDRLQSDSIWCFSPLEQVKSAMQATGYPDDLVNFVSGKVEDTLPLTKPKKIALLRLDTDWYESTRCELEHLFPLMVDGAVLIVDDYGHWEGCRRAVDEYFQKHGVRILLNRIDYTGRIGIVTR
ncbi:TylF/MycF family methyltransferase [Mariniblastus sp.]|nr:TylF/MycF family methyltransferase [Mariniblastus sp.]